MKYLIFLALMACSSLSYSKDYENGGVYFAPNDHQYFESNEDIQREEKEGDYNDPHTVKEVLWGNNQCEHNENTAHFSGQYEKCHDEKGNLRRHTDDGKTWMTHYEQKHKKFVHETPQKMQEKISQDRQYQNRDNGIVEGYKRHKQSFMGWIKEKAGFGDNEKKEVDVARNDVSKDEDNQEEVKKSNRNHAHEESARSEDNQQPISQYRKATSRRLLNDY